MVCSCDKKKIIIIRQLWRILITIFFNGTCGSYQNEKRRYEENSEFSNLFEFFYFNLTS